LLKEIVTAIQSFFKAHQFIVKHRLWKWILIPGIVYLLLFCVSMYFFGKSASSAIEIMSIKTGISNWQHKMQNSWLGFFFTLTGIMIWLLLMFFYFSLFKYLWLILGSPVFSYLSEKTEALLEGKEYPITWKQILKDMVRGSKLALRNALWQTVYTISILLLSFIPVVGWVTPVISMFVECYYYGFSMLDYSCERHQLSPSQSVAFISNRKGLAIGNGLGFYLMHFLPIIGWVLAPAYAVIAATISLYYQEKEV
jgi:CysZ protein